MASGTNKVTLDPASVAALAQEMGANAAKNNGKNASRLPELKINSQVDDENGNPLPRGQFYIKGLEQVAYAETVTLRPLHNGFQYLHYDTQAGKMVSKSKILNHFGEEARDTSGTVRCGKPVSSTLRDMPEDQRKKYSDITCFRQVRG